RYDPPVQNHVADFVGKGKSASVCLAHVVILINVQFSEIPREERIDGLLSEKTLMRDDLEGKTVLYYVFYGNWEVKAWVVLCEKAVSRVFDLGIGEESQDLESHELWPF